MKFRLPGLPVLVLLLLFPASVMAEEPSFDAEEWIRRGDLHAQNDRHPEAIAAYENALREDPGRRLELLPRLARQYLWMEESEKALVLFEEYLEREPFDCEIEGERALALSWSGRLKEARQAYRQLARDCSEWTWEAKLGEARVLRWMERPSAARAIYREIENHAPRDRRADARLGSALVDVMLNDNRKALEALQKLWDEGYRDPALVEAKTVAVLRLGSVGEARKVLREGAAEDVTGAGLRRLEEELDQGGRPVVRPALTTFSDADSTLYRRSRVDLELWNGGFFSSVGFAASRLEHDLLESPVTSRAIHLAAERRLNHWLALRVDGTYESIPELDFRPGLGEVRTVLTPDDKTRFDLSNARIVVADNVEAMQHHLTGRHVGIGLDRRLGDRTLVTLSLDHTDWSTGNRRLRVHFSPRHRFEGTPVLTLAWPTTYQSYDRSFDFHLFSPPEYWETGPRAELQWSPNRHWHTGLAGRLGAQQESEQPWRTLLGLQGRLERAFARHWALEVTGGYSNSNLAGPSGFRRTSLSVQLGYRF